MANSDMYGTLAATAKGFLDATRPKPAESNKSDPDLILSFLAPECRFDWGHKYFVSDEAPGLQGRKTGKEFVDHMTGMIGHLETWGIEIKDTIVDVDQRKVVMRADFWMKAKSRDAVLNDIVFFTTMDESGGKMIACTEYVDPAASNELGRRAKADPKQ